MIRCRDCAGVLHGTVGVARSLLGVGLSSPGMLKQRLTVCGTCDQSVKCRHNDRQVCRCKACGCWLKHKARLARETCPRRMW
jgi:PHP family Zn ribbon phosphoesterase